MNQKILRLLAVPNIVSNITVPLLGLVDLALMGHLDSEIYIGAIALGGVIFNFIYWGFSFLRMSTTGFTAQAYGEKNAVETITILARALLLVAIVSVLILLFQAPIAWASFKINRWQPRSRKPGKIVFQHSGVGRTGSFDACLFLTAGFLGMQNARIPMIVAISVNVINILLSAFFVFVLHMNSSGVALGTAISQYAGLLIAGIFFFKYYRHIVSRFGLTERDNGSAGTHPFF